MTLWKVTLHRKGVYHTAFFQNLERAELFYKGFDYQKVSELILEEFRIDATEPEEASIFDMIATGGRLYDEP